MMNSEILRRVLSEKRAIRERNEAEEQRRLAEAEKADPEIGRLVRERREAIFQGLQQAMMGVMPEGIEEATRKRGERIDARLRKLGHDADYLSPIFDCPLCEDSGYTGESKKELCSCVEKRMQALWLGDSLQDDSQTFEKYDDKVFPTAPLAPGQPSQRAYTRLLKEQCEAYANSLPGGPVKNLLLYGGSGLGKTFLLRSIAYRAAEHGIPCQALTANQLLNLIRKQYFARDEAEDAGLDSIPLLLIDDLGTEPLWENITIEQLFSLIDHRLRMGLNTVISTNLSLTELKARYTERITSRLLDKRQCKALAFMGKDIRLSL